MIHPFREDMVDLRDARKSFENFLTPIMQWW